MRKWEEICGKAGCEGESEGRMDGFVKGGMDIGVEMGRWGGKEIELWL